jgi:hypothetical protein
MHTGVSTRIAVLTSFSFQGRPGEQGVEATRRGASKAASGGKEAEAKAIQAEKYGLVSILART